MPLYVGESRVSRKNFFNRSSLTSLEAAWLQIQPLLLNPPLENSARIVLAKWRGDTEIRRFASWAELTKAIKKELGRRENYFLPAAGRKPQYRYRHFQDGGAHQQHRMDADEVLRGTRDIPPTGAGSMSGFPAGRSPT